MPVTDEAGTLLGVVKLAHDITSAVMAKQRVEQQSQLFDIVVAAHQSFLLDRNLGSACDTVFERLLSVSESSYGFIGIIQYEDGCPSLYVPPSPMSPGTRRPMPGMSSSARVGAGSSSASSTTCLGTW